MPGAYGMLGEFGDAAALAHALRAVLAAGYRRVEVFTPYPVEEVMAVLPAAPDPIPRITLCGGVAGAFGGYFLQWYTATQAYPINVGGRPPHSWPAFIPIVFELTVLGAAIAAVVALFVLCRLPRLRHPLFEVARFGCGARDRYFLCLRGDDALFAPEDSARLLEAAGASMVTVVADER